MAFLQLSLVSCNILFIARGEILFMLITSFLVSMIWTFNIKKVAFGNMIDRLIYASGAGLGTYVGYYISHLISR